VPGKILQQVPARISLCLVTQCGLERERRREKRGGLGNEKWTESIKSIIKSLANKNEDALGGGMQECEPCKGTRDPPEETRFKVWSSRKKKGSL